MLLKNKKLSLTCAALALFGGSIALCSLPANATQIGFSLNENEATNSLTSSLSGVGITTLGTDQWSIDFSGTPFANNLALNEAPYSWIDGSGYDNLTYDSGNLYTLTSDAVSPGGPYAGCGGIDGSAMPQGVTCFIGVNSAQTNQYFVTVKDVAPVPAPPSWLMMLTGLGLLGIPLYYRRKARRALDLSGREAI